MSLVGAVLGVAIPALLGCFAMIGLRGRPRLRYEWSYVLGYGYFIGTALVCIVIRLLSVFLGSFGIASVLALAVLLVLPLTPRALRLWGTPSDPVPHRSVEDPAGARVSGLTRAVGYTILAAVLLRFTAIAIEVWTLPTFPWDAWTAHAAKARIIVEHQRLEKFVDASAWIADPGSYWNIAHEYPITLSLIQAWTVLFAGQWDEAVANTPWLAVWLALGLGFYGQARRLGIPSLWTMAATYVLLSVPLVNVHVALAGYGDLWVAAMYCLAAMSFAQYLCRRDLGDAAPGVLLAVLLPTLKQEGIIWLLAFAPAIAVYFCKRRTLLRVCAAAIVVVSIWWWAGGISIDSSLIGRWVVTPEQIDAPFLPAYEVRFRNTTIPLLIGLFVTYDWNVLAYLTCFILVYHWRRVTEDALLRSVWTIVATSSVVYCIIFYLTGAAIYAEQYTASQRVLLQLMPALVFVLLMTTAPRSIGRCESQAEPV